jgi:hypothetical protein
MLQTTRRGFLAAAPATAMAWQAGGKPDWFDRPMRWVQLAFVEDDPGRYDLKFWSDYFRRIHADAATISAGGCVAFYPTQVPLHYKSKYMGEKDAFGELLGECRKLNMNVVARIDPHACHDDAYRAHPEWVAVDAEGKPRRHWAMPEYWVTCGLGPYNFEFMTAVVREIVDRYEVDGIFANRWSGSGMCYCEHCRKGFRAYSGLDLPKTNDSRDEARRKYVVWRDERLFALWDVWDAEIRKRNPRATFIPNTGGGALSEIEMKRAGEKSKTLFADRQARFGTVPPWANGKNAKEYRATLGEKAIAGLFSVGFEAPYRWKDSTQSSAEILIWAVDGIAHGMRPWVIKFNAKPTDTRWMKPVEDLFVWHWKNERYLKNSRSLSRVGLVYSQQTARFYGGEQARAKAEDAIQGAYHALVESRVPFEMVHDGLIDGAWARGLTTLVLPNIAALSDAQCAQLRAFVEKGGGIVATHETSLFDEWGKARGEFGLGDLFGVSYGGKTIERQQNAYLRPDKSAAYAGEFLKGLEDAGMLVHGVKRLEVRPRGEWTSPVLTVPSYPDLPMEEVYLREPIPRIPGVVAREAGKGRVVYFPWDIDRSIWDVMNFDHVRLFGNAVRWASRDGQSARVTGPGVLDIAYWEQAGSVALHLVNLTNPMMMKGPFREILPVDAQRVEMRLPEERRAKSVSLLVSGAPAKWGQRDGVVTLTTPRIGLHEVVAVDLA